MAARSSEHPAQAGRTNGAAPCPWEDLFRGMSPAEQTRLLGLVDGQGVLYAPQLPPASARSGTSLQFLTALLAGQANLEPLGPPRGLFGPDDTTVAELPGLDPQQREAVVRALQTPDVCLIRGYPGTGKSLVAFHIVLEAARRGERILFAAPGAAAVDHVLQRLAGREAVCPIRCLAAGERLEDLPPAVRRMTFAERVRSFEEDTLAAARSRVEALTQAVQARRTDEPLWDELLDLARQRVGHAVRLEELSARLSRIADEVAAQASVTPEAPSPFQARLAERRRFHADELTQLDRRVSELREQRTRLSAERDTIRQERDRLAGLRAARESAHWWSPAWWRARLAGDVASRYDEATRALEKKQGEIDLLEQELQGLDTQRQEHDRRLADDLARLRDEETARLQTELDQERTALQEQLCRLEEGAREIAGRLNADAARPADWLPEAVEAARRQAQEAVNRDEQQLEQARQWLVSLEQARPEFPARLRSCANVVASTVSGLAADPHFGDGSDDFDLLVLEEADLVTEADFQALARRARRWVLLGESPAAVEPPALRHGGRHGRGTPAVARPVSALRPDLFARLWEQLHDDPRRLGRTWSRRGDRLVCTLLPVPPEQQAWVQSEPVADRPEIELRLLAPPRSPRNGAQQLPQLVEVTFPVRTPLAEAKEYLFRELEELTVHTAGSELVWQDLPGYLVLRLAPRRGAEAVPVHLAAGVREWLIPLDERDPAAVGWHTGALEFDRAQGWTRELAEQWLQHRLPLRGLGRTVVLSTAHRMQPALGAWLSDLLFEGACEARPGDGHAAAPVEFIAVPSLPGEPDQRGRHEGAARYGASRGGTTTLSPRLRSVRGGAGVEIDLSGPRRTDAIPGELRAALPDQGLVNYLEAQALVRSLENLLADRAFQQAAQRWQKVHVGPCHNSADCACPDQCERFPAVAVVALYPAQAQLLGLLIDRSPAVKGSGIHIEVGLPSAFRQRECLVALVSLTRSHTHRAVTYGETPQQLVQALTRAAERLVLFGDPGTLVRRSQWQGPVDHLDAAAAERERALAAGLVCYLQGLGCHPRAFQLHESRGV